MNAAGYIYVLAFDNGTIKIGRTKNTGQRLNAHKSDAGKFCVTLTDQWMSPPHTEWVQNEGELKKIAVELGGTAHRREYYSGVDYAAVVAEAKRLSFTAPSLDAEPEPKPEPKPKPFRAPRLVDLAERQRIAEAEADWEDMIRELLRIARKGGFSPATFRGWSEACSVSDPSFSKTYAEVADLLEAQLNYEAGMSKFIRRVHIA